MEKIPTDIDAQESQVASSETPTPKADSQPDSTGTDRPFDPLDEMLAETHYNDPSLDPNNGRYNF